MFECHCCKFYTTMKEKNFACLGTHQVCLPEQNVLCIAACTLFACALFLCHSSRPNSNWNPFYALCLLFPLCALVEFAWASSVKAVRNVFNINLKDLMTVRWRAGPRDALCPVDRAALHAICIHRGLRYAGLSLSPCPCLVSRLHCFA